MRREQLPAPRGLLGARARTRQSGVSSAASEPRQRRRRRSSSARTARRPRAARSCRPARAGLREVARARDPQPLGVGDVRARRSHRARRATSGPTPCRSRARPLDRDRADRLRAVHEDRAGPSRLQLVHREQRPVVQTTCETAISLVRGVTAARTRSGSGGRDDDTRAGSLQRAEEPEMLVVGRDHLVLGTEVEPGDDDVAAVGRRAVSATMARVDSEERRRVARARARGARGTRRGTPCRSVPRRAAVELGLHRLDGRPRVAGRTSPRSGRRRARARERALVLPRRSSDRRLHRRVIREQRGRLPAPLLRPHRERRRRRVAHEDVVDAGAVRRPAGQLRQLARERLKSPASTTDMPSRATSATTQGLRRRALRRRLPVARVVGAWRFPTTEPVQPYGVADAPLPPAARRSAAPVVANGGGAPEQDRVRLAGDRRPDEALVQPCDHARRAANRDRAATAERAVIRCSSARAAAAPRAAAPGGTARPARRRSRGGSSARGSACRPGGFVLPWKTFQLRTRRATGRLV